MKIHQILNSTNYYEVKVVKIKWGQIVQNQMNKVVILQAL